MQPMSWESEGQDAEVSRVLHRAFEKAGGWDKWETLSTISYKKRSVLYLENGDVESDVTQFHEYQVKPTISASIFWRKEGNRHSIIVQDGTANKYLNGELVAENDPAVYKSFLSAHYVLFMPFKLADAGVSLTYEGVESLEDNVEVDVIKASYAPATHENHSTSDLWYYYFDRSNGVFLGSMVYHAPTYAYIKNSEINDQLPITMNTYRESYRVDKNRNREYLRGEFFYADYIMSFSDR